MILASMIKRVGGLYPISGPEFEPMTAKEVSELEQRLSTSFPESYRELLGRYGAFGFNGASEDDPYVYFESVEQLPEYVTDNAYCLIRGFYGRDIAEALEMFSSRIPSSLIPIAHDGGAGQICLGVSSEDTGKIYYWDMADEPLDDEDFEEDMAIPNLMMQSVATSTWLPTHLTNSSTPSPQPIKVKLFETSSYHQVEYDCAGQTAQGTAR